jgi:hypothetical protein
MVEERQRDMGADVVLMKSQATFDETTAVSRPDLTLYLAAFYLSGFCTRYGRELQAFLLCGMTLTYTLPLPNSCQEEPFRDMNLRDQL